MSWKKIRQTPVKKILLIFRAEFGSILASLIGLGVSSYRLVNAPSDMLAISIAVLSISAVIWAIYVAASKLSEINDEEQSRAVVAAIEVANEIINHHMDGECRVTLHVRSGRKHYVQATPYAGKHMAEGQAGRRFRIGCGIVGAAFRGKPFEIHIEKWKGNSVREYREELVSDWSYTMEEAEAIDPKAKSWAAVAIGEVRTNKVPAVLYCDSTEKNDFDSDDIQQLIALVTIALSQIVLKAGEHARRRLSDNE